MGLALLTLHDMQTAEGTGLYLAFQAGTRERGPYDLLVDLAGMMCLAGLVLLPCILLKQREPESFFRFLAAYLAFLPTVSTAALVHLLDGTEDIVIRQSLLEGNLPEALREGTAGIIPLLQVGVPVLVLAAALCRRRQGGMGSHGSGSAAYLSRRGFSRADRYLCVCDFLCPAGLRLPVMGKTGGRISRVPHLGMASLCVFLVQGTGQDAGSHEHISSLILHFKHALPHTIIQSGRTERRP